MTIGERTVNNAIFNMVSGIIPLLVSLIFWPYIVETLGDSSYGIYALVSTVIGYFSLLDLGLGNALVKYVAQYAGTDRRYTEAIVGTALSVFLVAALTGVVLVLSIAKPLATDWLKVPSELTDVAYKSFCVAAFGFFMTMQVTFFTSIVHGISRYDISGSAMAVMGIATTLGAVLLLRLGFGLIHLVWLNVLVSLLMVLFYRQMVHRLMPDIVLRLCMNRSALKKIFSFGMFAMLRRVTDVICNQVNLLVIGAMLGVASVTYYVIPFNILKRLTNLLSRIGMVIFPAVSELQGQNRHETICELYLTTSRIIFSFTAAIMVPLLVFGPHFLRLWLEPEFARRGGQVMQILTASIFLGQCTNVPGYVANGLGHPKVHAYATMCIGVLFLVLMIPGVYFGGIVGVAIARLISYGLVAPVFIRYVTCRMLGLSLLQLLKESYLRPLLAAAVVTVILLLIPAERIGNLLFLVGVMGAGAGLYLVLAFLFGVYQTRERRILWQYLRGVWARVRRGGAS